VKPHFTEAISIASRSSIIDPSFATPQTARFDPVLGFLRQAWFAPKQAAAVLTS
jgi:hypothetical protein